ncbi:hypothetical protein PFISCL1PPCAC_6096, partial [Pristionchus fissidentatus]
LFQMSLQPSTTSFATQPYLHFSSLKSNSDGRHAIHSLEKTHLSKNDVIRLVMDKDKPVFPVKAKFDTMRPLGLGPPPPPSAALLKRKREMMDERGVEEEVARNVSKILSATRAAQNGLSTVSSKGPSTVESSWSSTQSISPPLKTAFNCDACSKSFPTTKGVRSHLCIAPTDTTTAINGTVNLSQVNQTPTTPLDMTGYDSTDIPSNLITPDMSSYESSPPSETSMDESWMGLDKDEEGGDRDSFGRRTENKSCNDCNKVLCSSSNLKRHRATCKYIADVKDEPSHVAATLDLPKWTENKSQSWLQLSVGEHLKAKHMGRTIALKEEGKDEKWKDAIPTKETVPLPLPIVNKDEEIKVSILVEKDEKNGTDTRFSCSVCYKSFSCRKNVRRHMMAIHKVAPPPGAPLSSAVKGMNGSTGQHKSSGISTPRGSEDSMDGEDMKDEGRDDCRNIKKEDDESQSIPTPPPPPTVVLKISGKNETGGKSEKDPLIGFYEKDEKMKIPKMEVKGEKEGGGGIGGSGVLPLDFTLAPSNKKMRIENIREEDKAMITAQSVKFCVSRLAAMKASPYLASLLATSREITIDVLPSALQTLLVVHSDHSSLTVDNVVSVSETALKLKVTHVRNLCEKFITYELPKYSLLRAIRLADLYKLVKLKDQLFECLNIDILRSMSLNDDYRDMRSELKAELLEKFGEYL